MRTNIGGRIAARSLVAAGIICAQACASSGSTAAPLRPASPAYLPGAAAISADRAVTGEQLRGVVGFSTLDALRQLRPEFLFPRPSTSGLGTRAELAVYENSVHLGGVEELRRIPIDLVIDMYRLSETDARLQLGAYCECRGGVLLVRTQR
jgi:hypothetical protein